MIFMLPLLGSAISALGVGAATTAATSAASASIGTALGAAVLGGLGKGIGESFVKNVFCDTVRPKRGSVLKVDLVGGGATHSGVYLGNGRIAEVTEIGGKAVVRTVSPSEFLGGDGLFRTGAFIYVAAAYADGAYRALGSEAVARRAEASLGGRGTYSLAFNNCHMFTRYCITGESLALPTWSVDRVARALRETFDVAHVSWRSAGDFA